MPAKPIIRYYRDEQGGVWKVWHASALLDLCYRLRDGRFCLERTTAASAWEEISREEAIEQAQGLHNSPQSNDVALLG